MLTRLAVAATVLGAALVAVHAAARAEEPPAAAAAPSWNVKLQLGNLAVARDGKWIATWTGERFQLLPAAGGAPVDLDLGKDEKGSFECEFTGDSKWLVVPGEANSVLVKGLPDDTTQSILLFPVAAPSKRKSIQVKLKPKPMNKELVKYQPSLRDMKKLEGEVLAVVTLPGSRVLFDRNALGCEICDAASGSRFAAPASLDGPYYCGIDAEATRSVKSSKDGLEVRDVKTNRVLKSLPFAADDRERWSVWPAFTPDGADVLVVRERTPEDEAGARAPRDYTVECWSIAEAKRRWAVPVGTAERFRGLFVAGALAAVHADEALRLLDLRDGREVESEVRDVKVSAAAATADGQALWIAVDGKSIRRVPLPAVEPR